MERAAGYVTLYAAVDGAREADVAGELLRGCTEVKGQICRCSIQLFGNLLCDSFEECSAVDSLLTAWNLKWLIQNVHKTDVPGGLYVGWGRDSGM